MRLLNHVSCVPACQRSLRVNVLTCQGSLCANLLACQHGLHANVPAEFYNSRIIVRLIPRAPL